MIDDPIAGIARLITEQRIEELVRDWESPFPMTARTQNDMAENRHRVVQEAIQRLLRRIECNTTLGLL